MVGGVMELDLHGMNTYQAAAVSTACASSTATGAAPPSGICCGRCTTSAVK